MRIEKENKQRHNNNNYKKKSGTEVCISFKERGCSSLIGVYGKKTENRKHPNHVSCHIKHASFTCIYITYTSITIQNSKHK